MSYLNKMGVTAVGAVALTGESPDDIVYPELYGKVEKDATVRVSFFPAMREEVERNRELYKTYRSEMLQMGGREAVLRWSDKFAYGLFERAISNAIF